MGNAALDIARSYVRAGLSVIPIRADGSKAPALVGEGAVKPYMRNRATEGELVHLFPPGVGVGVIGGAVSGRVEILDFDKPGLFDEWMATLEAFAPPVADLARALPRVSTPSGGMHLYYRCSEIGGSAKLAFSRVPFRCEFTGKMKSTLIETKAEGGYVVAPGSPAACHETGREYTHAGGAPLTAVPTIKADDRDVLLRVARSFDERPQEAREERRPAARSDGARPGDDFNVRATWSEILEPVGAVRVRSRGDKIEWRRPGKDDEGISATTGHCGDNLYVFTSNWPPFEAGRIYSKFTAYGRLYHDGDFQAAARELGLKGYGEQISARARTQQGPGDDDAPPFAADQEQDAPPSDAAPPPPGGDEGDGSGPLILDPADPRPSARRFVLDEFTSQGQRTLHHHQGEFFAWLGSHYRAMPEGEIDSHLYTFLERAWRLITVGENEKLVQFKPNRTKVGDVRHALQALTLLVNAREPAWIEHRDFAAEDVLACTNGLLYLPTRELLEHTPLFFNRNAVPFGYHPSAGEPVEWMAFLRQLWPDDPEAIQTLQDIFGYLLTGDTRHQKIFMLVGPKRSGKGTIGRILGALVGADNVCSPTLSSLGTNFGMAPLIGKRLALIADARLGGKVDQHVVAERLLSISGEDAITVDRKYLTAWTGRLPVRFVVLTNELPRITDASGALASRFVILTMRESFYGREDLSLETRLRGELPAILNWALAGLDRLRERGHFIQPASSEGAVRELEDLGSPTAAFVRDRCAVRPGLSIECKELFEAWKAWCEEQGRDHSGSQQTFGRDLRAVCPGVTIARPRNGEDRNRVYEGITLHERASGPRWSADHGTVSRTPGGYGYDSSRARTAIDGQLDRGPSRTTADQELPLPRPPPSPILEDPATYDRSED